MGSQSDDPPGLQSGDDGFRRDQSMAEASGRAKSADRKPMWIVLDAEDTEFQPFTDNLRIHGIICEAKMDKVAITHMLLVPGMKLKFHGWEGYPNIKIYWLNLSKKVDEVASPLQWSKVTKSCSLKSPSMGCVKLEIRLHFEVVENVKQSQLRYAKNS